MPCYGTKFYYMDTLVNRSVWLHVNIVLNNKGARGYVRTLNSLLNA
jgi:hypothetical protein